jgi:hypothetical protein
MRRWWRGFQQWLSLGGNISLAMIPTGGDLISITRRLRKGLRDVRDRANRHDRRWRAVSMAGLVDEDHALVLIRHTCIDRNEVWSILARRWPDIVLSEPGNTEPSSILAVADAATLARRRRGLEPMRIVIMRQVAVTAGSTSGGDQPMALLI